MSHFAASDLGQGYLLRSVCLNTLGKYSPVFFFFFFCMVLRKEAFIIDPGLFAWLYMQISVYLVVVYGKMALLSVRSILRDCIYPVGSTEYPQGICLI